jgi:predicted alternative tryptophan synthase beta-subunit
MWADKSKMQECRVAVPHQDVGVLAISQQYKEFESIPDPRKSAMQTKILLPQSDIPTKIFFKNESVSPAGSNKPNTAIAQAYYNWDAGIRRLTTETGAGQWDSALALAGRTFDMEIRVYMVKVSYHQKPYRRSMMQTWGAEVFAGPSDRTEAGRKILCAHPDSEGSLGIAISEAVEEAA